MEARQQTTIASEPATGVAPATAPEAPAAPCEPEASAAPAAPGAPAAPCARGAFSAADIRRAMRVYAVTDSAWLNGRTLESCVAQAVAGGATFVQLREKNLPHAEMVALARAIKPVCEAAHVPFVVNDDVAAAKEAGADGVHVGQLDVACTQARAALGPKALVGVSVHTVAQALKAQAEGADYLGVGAMFATSTKEDATVVSKEELAAICKAVKIPVVIIGGVKAGNVEQFAGCGFDGAAVVSAIFAAPDIAQAAQELSIAVDGALVR